MGTTDGAGARIYTHKGRAHVRHTMSTDIYTAEQHDEIYFFYFLHYDLITRLNFFSVGSIQWLWLRWITFCCLSSQVGRTPAFL